jgi:hypothetical protein
MSPQALPPTQETTQPQFQEPQDTSAFDRWMALKLLRENMLYSDPSTYAMTDIAEDLPGAAKPVGHVLKNVLPSMSIIQKDPEARRAQIDQAIARIKSSKSSKEELKKEMLHNALSMGKATVLPSFALSALVALFGRMPWGKAAIAGTKSLMSPAAIAAEKSAIKLLPEAERAAAMNSLWAKATDHQKYRTALRSPIHFGGVKKFFSDPRYRKALLGKSLLTDTMPFVGAAALSGAITPALAYGSQVSDKALGEARKVMEEQPYITSLPASEMLSVIKQTKGEKENTPLQNIGTGTALGAVTGGLGGLTPAAVKAAIALASFGKFGPKGGLMGKNFLNSLKRDVTWGTVGGALTGALSGASTKNYIEDEYNRMHEEQAQPTPAIPSTLKQNERPKSTSYTI